jgi:hypothetical protein
MAVVYPDPKFLIFKKTIRSDSINKMPPHLEFLVPIIYKKNNHFSKFLLLQSYLKYLNRLPRRRRGMASNPLFIIPDFFLHFPSELSYGYLRFEGNGKIPLGRQGKSSALLAFSV